MRRRQFDVCLFDVDPSILFIWIVTSLTRHYVDVTMSVMAFKSPATPQFVRPFVYGKVKEHIKARVTHPL